MAHFFKNWRNASKLKNIKLIITDVDGVLTPANINYSGDGELFKEFHVRDGLAFNLLQACNLPVGVISGRSGPVLDKRLADLKVSDLSLLGIRNKKIACKALADKVGCALEEVAFIGDDVIDLPAFEVCGLGVAVADASQCVREAAHLVLGTPGGKGAFREFAEQVAKAQGFFGAFSTADGFLAVMESTKATALKSIQ